MDDKNNVVELPLDPIAKARAILESGREEFREALRLSQEDRARRNARNLVKQPERIADDAPEVRRAQFRSIPGGRTSAANVARSLGCKIKKPDES